MKGGWEYDGLCSYISCHIPHVITHDVLIILGFSSPSNLWIPYVLRVCRAMIP